MGIEEGTFPQVTAQNESRHGRKRIEMQAERPAAISRPPTLDNAPQRGAGIEPKGQLGRLKADDKLRAAREAFVG